MERVGRTMAEAGILSRRRAATHRPRRNKTRRCNVDDDENTNSKILANTRKRYLYFKIHAQMFHISVKLPILFF